MQGRVAIVHDWLTSMRGGERVVEALYRVFPKADLYTLTWDPARLSADLVRRGAVTSLVDRIAHAPGMNGRFRAMLPLFPLAVESFDLRGYSLVVSSSHCVALGALVPPGTLHVGYVHSTLRYVREGQATYEASVPGGRLGRAVFRGVASYLRQWEVAAGTRPHVLLANSRYTRDRIRWYLHRDAQVVEPPIETARFERAAARAAPPSADAPFLVVSALVPNKRVDLAIRAFEGRKERLLVVGEGPERERLSRLAGPNVTLRGRVTDAELEGLYANSRALLHTAVDDFGMAMAESLAAGRPVLACAEGGALDIVDEGRTGMLVPEPTVAQVRATLDRFAAAPFFDVPALQRSARRFDTSSFERRFAHAVDEARRTHDRASGDRRAFVHGGFAPIHSPATHVATAMVAKRAVDVLLAGTGLALTTPLMLGLGVLIVIDSEGPALFRQQRLGLDQRVFTMVKLRTMDREGRVTRMGRLLRPLGLDELPQLWNVLRGDMSLIGPRPEVPERVERFARDLPSYPVRHRMRPGITGWAQVNGLRGDVPIAERLRFDLEYLRSWSLAMDGRILMRTVPAVWGDTLRSALD